VIGITASGGTSIDAGTIRWVIGVMAQLRHVLTGRVRVGGTVGATEGAVEPSRRYSRRVLTARTRPRPGSWAIAPITIRCGWWQASW